MQSQKRILVVDDDPDFLEAVRAVLVSQPYQVFTALGGPEGLRQARAQIPDLILLDIIMPELDGFEVCRRLKEDAALAHIPIMMITSFSEKYMETSLSLSQGLTLEADDFIDKPLVPAELLLRVEKLLHRKTA
ncbi:MAG: response regulator [Chloroflexota bacterium]|nr:MAG: response regulator [Chloroflexota bacterium]